MRDNGLRARQKWRFKRTTDSHHAWPVAPHLLDQDFTAARPDKKWGADISYVWTREGWLYPSSSTCSHAGSLAGQQATGCTATWLSPPCVKPWSCAVQQQG